MVFNLFNKLRVHSGLIVIIKGYSVTFIPTILKN